MKFWRVAIEVQCETRGYATLSPSCQVLLLAVTARHGTITQVDIDGDVVQLGVGYEDRARCKRLVERLSTIKAEVVPAFPVPEATVLFDMACMQQPIDAGDAPWLTVELLGESPN